MNNEEDNLTKVLKERGKSYGSFKNIASTEQNIHRAIRKNYPEWEDKFEDYQVVALRQIIHKMARSLEGDPKYLDNWVDIQGYAKLVEKEILKTLGLEGE